MRIIVNCDRNFDIAILIAMRCRSYYLIVVIELQQSRTTWLEV